MVYGTTYNDGSLVCCAVDKGLIRIDLKDNSITPVVRCSLSYWSYITTNGNNIYYTNDKTDRVTCCDMNGKVEWEFHGVPWISCTWRSQYWYKNLFQYCIQVLYQYCDLKKYIFYLCIVL